MSAQGSSEQAPGAGTNPTPAAQTSPDGATQTPKREAVASERLALDDLAPGSADSFGSSSSALVQLASVATVAAAAAAQRQRYSFANFTQPLSPPTSFNLNGSDFNLPFPLTELRSLPTTTELLGSPTLLMQNTSVGLADEEDPLLRLLRQEGSFGGNQAADRPSSAAKRPRTRSPVDDAIGAGTVTRATADQDRAETNAERLSARPPAYEPVMGMPVTNEPTLTFASPRTERRAEPRQWSPGTPVIAPSIAAGASMDDSHAFENERIDRFSSASNERVPEGLRAERNRQAAAASRERRRAVVNDLEARNRVLSEQNAQAQIEVLTLKREMSELIRHFKAQLERQEREKMQLVTLIQQQRDRIAQLRKVEQDTADLMGLANVDEIGAGGATIKPKGKPKPASS
ncbi:hypothetical protein F1559_004385 [Cyanidiococcus yangmingshanensis]|uniref:BZIP domain-containing protein n=1 Tax=Cyanidiococcus yangmingshanensis TaxID=2690220 RepID=A0A7J7ISI8_9RHOD|nr:hypothetical protein F1559_004385 [Cyanidiococcus yangmingshanensis]